MPKFWSISSNLEQIILKQEPVPVWNRMVSKNFIQGKQIVKSASPQVLDSTDVPTLDACPLSFAVISEKSDTAGSNQGPPLLVTSDLPSAGENKPEASEGHISQKEASPSPSGQDQPDRAVPVAAAQPQLSPAKQQLQSADPVTSPADQHECEEPVICATKVIHCGWLDNTLPPPRCPPAAQPPPEVTASPSR